VDANSAIDRRAGNCGTRHRLHDGLVIVGSRAWGPQTGPGTSRGREEAIELLGEYRLTWQDYSNVGGSRGRFRCLPIAVG
jgi:hypothetical protein